MDERRPDNGERHEILDASRCVIIGSFRFTDKINEAIDQFERNGIKVLAPRRGRVIQDIEGYKVLDVDEGRSPLEIQRNYFWQIKRADFIYVINPGGYIGTESTWEIGWALGAGKPVYASEPLDSNLPPQSQSVYHRNLALTIRTMPLDELISKVNDGSLGLEDYFLGELNKQVEHSNNP